MRPLLALLAVLAIAGILVTAAGTLSEPAYIKAANKICSQRAAKLARPKISLEDLRIAAWKHALGAAVRGKKGMALGYLGKSNVLGARAAEISTGLDIERCE